MTYQVLLTRGAVRDLEDIDAYITSHDSDIQADYVLDKITEAFESLSELPDRGAYPKELQDLGIKEYREIFFKPYRIIYRVVNKKIYIFLIADGRRDMQTILQRRLLAE